MRMWFDESQVDLDGDGVQTKEFAPNQTFKFDYTLLSSEQKQERIDGLNAVKEKIIERRVSQYSFVVGIPEFKLDVSQTILSRKDPVLNNIEIDTLTGTEITSRFMVAKFDQALEAYIDVAIAKLKSEDSIYVRNGNTKGLIDSQSDDLSLESPASNVQDNPLFIELMTEAVLYLFNDSDFVMHSNMTFGDFVKEGLILMNSDNRDDPSFDIQLSNSVNSINKFQALCNKYFVNPADDIVVLMDYESRILSGLLQLTVKYHSEDLSPDLHNNLIARYQFLFMISYLAFSET